MQPLPLPPLEQTIDKFLNAIEPVFSPQDIAEAKVAAKEFLDTQGVELQTQLTQYAQTQAEQGKSWLSDHWLDGYLSGREVKALSSNVGFQIDFSSTKTQFARVAEFIHLIAQTHRDFLQNRITPPDDGRGNSLSMDGWKVLRGAMRLPKAQCDDFYYATNQVSNRHISILWNNQHYLLPVTDENGHVLSELTLAEALQTLTEKPAQASLPFSLISALPSEEAEKHLTKLCENPHNQKVYDKLKNSWFCLSIFNSKSESEIALLQQQTFNAGQAWQYKPFTYQMDLNSDFISVHVEHTGIDGGTLQAILKHAFKQKSTHKTDTQAQLEPCNWEATAEQIEAIKAAASHTDSAAKHMKIRKFNTDYSALNMKISHDAVIQFSLVYAQLKVFKQLRNTYEAVDTSHFLAGRTECLRPNTPQALNLCQKLILDKADAEDLQTALSAHKAWVIDCKKGQAIDRHLYALSKQPQQSSEAFFKFVRQFCQADFLSTSTVGTQSPIRRFVFAPTSADGFGVNYSMNATDYEYCLISNANSIVHLNSMEEAIKEGVAKLISLIIKSN